MITSTGIRNDARNHLSNKWGKGALITLCYAIIEFALNFISSLVENVPIINLIVSIGIVVISVPISYGLVVAFMKLKRDEDINAFDFLSLGFSSFSMAWKVAFRMIGKLIVPIILTIVSNVILIAGFGLYIYSANIMVMVIGFIAIFASGIYAYIKQLSYVLSYKIAYDEPDLTSKEVVEKSQALMKGNRGNYFVLTLSFIGWAFLATLTFGIGYLWLLPYMQVSFVCFYDTIKKNSEIVSGE